jgi:carbonic anhydrase
VTVLKVAHIVIIGHSNCGGVAACHEMCESGSPALETSFVGRWMDILRPGYEKLPPEADPAERLRAFEQEGVLVSLRNLETFPFVREAVTAGELTLHGAWMDIAEGVLHLFNPATRSFDPVGV